jgi:hypothetical protein
MPRRRPQSQPPVEDVAIGVIAELYATFLDSRTTCAQLIELRFTGTPVESVREEALAVARNVALVVRATMQALVDAQLLDMIPAELNPSRVLPAISRIGYALVALAEDAPEPEALMTVADLEALPAQYGIEAWLARCAELAREEPPA